MRMPGLDFFSGMSGMISVLYLFSEDSGICSSVIAAVLLLLYRGRMIWRKQYISVWWSAVWKAQQQQQLEYWLIASDIDMAPLSSCNANHVVFLVLLLSFSAQLHGSWGQAGNDNFVTFQNSQFNSEFFVSWETSNVLTVDEGRTLQLLLTENSGELQLASRSIRLAS